MQYLSELERGQKEASSEILAALCEALGVELADLLADVGRTLVEEREHRASVVRLESIRAGRRPVSPTKDASDPLCLLAAA